MTKEQRKIWEEEKRAVRGITDRLGMPVDRPILETVAILRLVGIHTQMSCGGHVDRLLSPYVTFASPDPNSELRRAYAKDEDQATRHRLKRRRTRRNVEELRILLPYLERFYQGRGTPLPKRLVVQGFGPSGYRLVTQACDLVAITPRPERRIFLDEQRQEFRDFTEFLKTEFFAGIGTPLPGRHSQTGASNED